MVDIYDCIKANGNGPFEWGKRDCLTFCANVVRDMTGTDHIAEFRIYSNAMGAARLLKSLGGIEAAVSRQLGDPCSINQLRKGDVAMADVGNGDALGVVCGTTVAFKDKDGVLFLPRNLIKKGWRI